MVCVREAAHRPPPFYSAHLQIYLACRSIDLRQRQGGASRSVGPVGLAPSPRGRRRRPLYSQPPPQATLHVRSFRAPPRSHEHAVLAAGERRATDAERVGGAGSGAAYGRLLCIAARDGLAMYELTQQSTSTSSGISEGPHCNLVWETAQGTHFAAVAFSRDSHKVAAVRWDTGTLEIRDARSSTTLKEIDDFPAVYQEYGHNCISFTEELLAVTGRKDKPNQADVRLYQVNSDFAVLKTLTVSGARVNNVTMSPDGTKLAVGMGWDGVAIFSKGTNDWSDPPQQLTRKALVSLCTAAFSLSLCSRSTFSTLNCQNQLFIYCCSVPCTSPAPETGLAQYPRPDYR